MPPVSFRGEHGATTARQGVLTIPLTSESKSGGNIAVPGKNILTIAVQNGSSSDS